jgi:hypothetical protein
MGNLIVSSNRNGRIVRLMMTQYKDRNLLRNKMKAMLINSIFFVFKYRMLLCRLRNLCTFIYPIHNTTGCTLLRFFCVGLCDTADVLRVGQFCSSALVHVLHGLFVRISSPSTLLGTRILYEAP